MVTIKNIAKKVGVCESIVSRALNNDQLVKDSIRELIMTGSQEMGYIAAQSLANRKNEAIGIIMNSISGIDYEPVIDGIRFANQAGYTLISADSSQDLELEKLLDRVDGLIMISSPIKEKQRIQRLIDRGIPMVLVESYISDPRANYIRANNVEGGFIATRYLIGLGHTRIAHITGDLNYQVLLDRMEGYQKALYEANLPPQPELIVTSHSTSLDDGYWAMKRLLAFNSNLTAVFAANDHIALGALKAIDEAGLSVQGDISVVGYEDSQFSKNTNPPLTTVRQPYFEMGERAMVVLTAILQNHCAKNEGMKICFLPKLVTRGTTNYLWNTSVSPIALGNR
ncbi:MAG TPA: LacI family DNA-binding transcriptional regulator [Bacillota bacterium]|nr:LacI family DNA-binding transcriptional regulator [Bacillota bacterium]